MTALTIRLGDDFTMVEVDGAQHVIPLGPVTLSSAEFTSDPPRPEELTNAIGAVVDHLDDMVRELPQVVEADDVCIVGDLAAVVAAVEFGGPPPLPFPLVRAAAEDVFRTVATEAAAARSLNPGLPSSAVDSIVAACCIVVAVMRHLHLDEVVVGDVAVAKIVAAKIVGEGQS